MGTGLARHDKAAILLEAIERYFVGLMSNEERSADFLKLLSIFKMHVPIDSVASAMEKEYNEEKTKCTLIHQAGIVYRLHYCVMQTYTLGVLCKHRATSQLFTCSNRQDRQVL